MIVLHKIKDVIPGQGRKHARVEARFFKMPDSESVAAQKILQFLLRKIIVPEETLRLPISNIFQTFALEYTNYSESVNPAVFNFEETPSLASLFSGRLKPDLLLDCPLRQV